MVSEDFLLQWLASRDGADAGQRTTPWTLVIRQSNLPMSLPFRTHYDFFYQISNSSLAVL